MRSIYRAGVVRLLALGAAGGVVVNGLRLRRRLTAMPVVPTNVPDGAPEVPAGGSADGPVVVSVAGGGPDAATVAAAVSVMRAEGLVAVDLVPGDLPAEELLDLLRLSDPRALRTGPLSLAFGAGNAVVVDADLAERAGIVPGAVDTVDVRRAFQQAKRYAPLGVGQAVAPGLQAVPLTDDQTLAVWRAEYGRPLPMVLATRFGPAVAALLGLRRAPWAALATAAGAALQPALVTARTAARPADRSSPATSVGRPAAVPWRVARSAGGRWRPAHPAHTDPAFIDEERARRYADDLARGVERFVGPRRDDCPVCGSTAVRPRFAVPDLVQCKEGTFRVDRCDGCGTLFQNPQLTEAGLDFYYRDFYDGSGESDTERAFSSAEAPYRRRAHLIDRFGSPRRWLDVGGGHGHFCLVAGREHPGTRFELLDQPAPADEARRRGWVADSHGDLFPKAAQSLAGTFDVVSMFHYLEHTTDPVAELAAAYEVLQPGGHLIVEVPTPDCRPASWLGPLWGPLMQPQHLHLLPLDTLVDQVRRQGFDVVHTDRRRPRQSIDVTWAAFQVIARRVPGPNAPWSPPRTGWHRLARLGAFVLGAPLMAVGIVVDRLVIHPFAVVDPTLSSVSWLVARKPEAPASAS